jgi:hypothetical protein
MNTYYLPFSKTIIPKTMKLINQEVKIDEHDGKEATKKKNGRIDGKNRWSTKNLGCWKN